MSHSALLLVDLQNDFMPGGSLAVPQGDEVVSIANHLIEQNKFDYIIASQDWHPQNHSSFESLWPVHCVQNTSGSELVKNLNQQKINKIIHKGTDIEIDSYSAFFDNEYLHKTDLDHYLREHHITRLYIMGLATDYCVKFTVLDALELGYTVTVFKNGCRGINLNPNDIENAFFEMQKAGAVLQEVVE